MTFFSVATLVLSFLAFVFAFYTWRRLDKVHQRVDEAVNKVEEATNKKLEKIANEVRGRTFAILGYIIGELSVDDDEQPEEPTDAERLREAIYYCRKAYEFLKGSGIPTEFMALNNMLQYYCILGISDDTSMSRDALLAEARRLRAAAEEHDSPNLLLTYARTVLKFGVEPEEIEKACSIIAEVRSRPDRLNEKQKREAELLTLLCQQRTKSDLFMETRAHEGR